jgi:hypothetical protein
MNLLYVFMSEKKILSLGIGYHTHIYIYLGLGSYRLTIKERNCGVVSRGKSRVVDESTPCVANMNCIGFNDGESELLEGVNRGSGGKMTIFSNGSYDQSEYPNPLIYTPI